MAEKVFTYLLGAGASFDVLPTVKDFTQALHEFKVEMNNYSNNGFDFELLQNKCGESDNPQEDVRDVLRDMLWLITESKNHSSVDTFAKKLYLRNDYDNLTKVKGLLDVFFTIQQHKKGVDLRYDTFFASILKKGPDKKIELPNNIKVITWNYDFQLELSFNSFYNADDINVLEDRLQIFPRKNLIKLDNTKFSVIKLNGVATGYEYQNGKYNRLPIKPIFNEDFKKEKKIPYAEVMIARYLGYTKYSKEGTESSIFFAWEEGEIPKTTRITAKECTNETRILTIIGYSFPTFNRVIDKEIIDNMTHLEKVYIQAPEDSINSVAQRFKAIKPKVNVELLTGTDEFFIPFEYNL